MTFHHAPVSVTLHDRHGVFYHRLTRVFVKRFIHADIMEYARAQHQLPPVKEFTSERRNPITKAPNKWIENLAIDSAPAGFKPSCFV